MQKEILLGVNIDHVATLRKSRGTRFPDPIQAALIAEQAGANSITAHLREDRRHIQDRDIYLLQEMLHTRLNLEMAATDEMLAIATNIKPSSCCLVPEKRAELTTEGGLDVATNTSLISATCQTLTESGIVVSLFINPDLKQIDAVAKIGGKVIELHTGNFADAKNTDQKKTELIRIQKAAKYAYDIGLQVNAGHGLHFHNVTNICSIKQITELNIGHSIIAQAIFCGLAKTVADLKKTMQYARLQNQNYMT